jgi:hypothetical protein
MRNSQLPPLNSGSVNTHNNSLLRQTILGKYPKTQRAILNPAPFGSMNPVDQRLSIDKALVTPKNRLQRTVKQNLRSERPSVQSTAMSDRYDFVESPLSPTDVLKVNLDQLQGRYKKLIGETKEISHQVRNGATQAGFPKIGQTQVTKFSESKCLSKLQEYQNRKVAIAIKTSDLENQIEGLTCIAEKYQQKIERYEKRFLAMDDEEKYQVVDTALHTKRLARFIKGKPIFKKYRMDSQSSLDF